MKVLSSEGFENDFIKLAAGLQERIKEKLRFFIEQENIIAFAKKLKGYKDVYRFRVGDYRIVFRFSENEITLLFVKHRKDIYEGL